MEQIIIKALKRKFSANDISFSLKDVAYSLYKGRLFIFIEVQFHNAEKKLITLVEGNDFKTLTDNPR
jgi:hypothetical protein